MPSIRRIGTPPEEPKKQFYIPDRVNLLGRSIVPSFRLADTLSFSSPIRANVIARPRATPLLSCEGEADRRYSADGAAACGFDY